MKLYKFELENFIAYLDKLKTDRTDTRHRVKFKGLLADHHTELLNDANDINLDYVIKDKDGNPIVENGKYTFEKDNERLSELNKLYNEEIVIDETEERKAMLLSVKESVINRGPTEFTGTEGDWYVRFCEIVEQIEYKDEQ
ncbi:DUF1617 family protein [Paenibacillus sp. CMAA1739]|uniref:DUF1617 family protein n=1 Tax=Paenibacillus ottowii TaxID=2315729 RepID=UPI002DBDB875|nr:DUF1617 family protein [Paenibacillus sp. CMAA1739]MEC4565332.1 DUF1617 family protein [Paenibacillus sp. CMAA1739]